MTSITSAANAKTAIERIVKAVYDAEVRNSDYLCNNVKTKFASSPQNCILYELHSVTGCKKPQRGLLAQEDGGAPLQGTYLFFQGAVLQEL